MRGDGLIRSSFASTQPFRQPSQAQQPSPAATSAATFQAAGCANAQLRDSRDIAARIRDGFIVTEDYLMYMAPEVAALARATIAEMAAAAATALVNVDPAPAALAAAADAATAPVNVDTPTTAAAAAPVDTPGAVTVAGVATLVRAATPSAADIGLYGSPSSQFQDGWDGEDASGRDVPAASQDAAAAASAASDDEDVYQFSDSELSEDDDVECFVGGGGCGDVPFAQQKGKPLPYKLKPHRTKMVQPPEGSPPAAPEPLMVKYWSEPWVTHWDSAYGPKFWLIYGSPGVEWQQCTYGQKCQAMMQAAIGARANRVQGPHKGALATHAYRDGSAGTYLGKRWACGTQTGTSGLKGLAEYLVKLHERGGESAAWVETWVKPSGLDLPPQCSVQQQPTLA